VTLDKDLGVIAMRHFIVVEENADLLYKKTYFFNKILKIRFLPTNCFSNTTKAVEIKIIHL